jgi:murein L,D-transpeptidase YcbB/YkuD
MSGPRRDRILAGTALALILAAPFAASAQDGAIEGTKSAAVGIGGAPAVSAPAAFTGDEPAGSIEPSPATPGSSAPSATEPQPAPDPLASLDPAERVLAEKIRDLLATKAESIFAGRTERSAAAAFYQGRNYVPLWLDKGVENARAKAVIARLKDADADGLEARDYRTPNFAEIPADALAEADLKLTRTVLTFARHLQAGRFAYTRMSSNIQLPQTPPDPAAVLGKIVDAEDAGKALDEFSPPHEAYRRLKAKLAEMRGKSAAPVHDIADGPVLKLNPKSPMQDPRVPSLRERLGMSGDASDLAYDANLAAAVRKFQQASELPATGSLDARTIKELNAPAKDSKYVDLVVANMERWRWYPRDLGPDHVIVNQPEFMLKVIHNGAQVWTTKVVIGDTSGGKQTPLLSETMKSITVNPTWNVPPSIVNNEYIPAMQRDPWALQRMGLLVSYNRDGSIHISQPPGGNNVLGHLRFNFPNKFLVYQHDTNEKFMFAHEQRTFSHGCMRVQDPAKYAEVLLNLARPSEHWTQDRVTRMFGTGEQDISLPSSAIWVHVTYQSAFVDDAGKLQIRRDVYGVDSRTIAAIKSERGVIEAAPPPEAKPTAEQPEVASASPNRRKPAVAQRNVSFLQSFFFGAPAQQPRAVRPPRSVAH